MRISRSESLIFANLQTNGKTHVHAISYFFEKEPEMIDWLADMRLPL